MIHLTDELSLVPVKKQGSETVMDRLQLLFVNLGRLAMLTALVLVGLLCLGVVLFEIALIFGAGASGGGLYLMLQDPPESIREILGQ